HRQGRREEVRRVLRGRLRRQDGVRPLMAIEYRHYQTGAVEAMWEAFDGGANSTAIVLPTGTGKTVVAGLPAQRAGKEGGAYTLLRAGREALPRQAGDEFRNNFGLTTAFEMADQDARASEPRLGKPDVVLGSVMTMQGNRLARWPQDRFDLIV